LIININTHFASFKLVIITILRIVNILWSVLIVLLLKVLNHIKFNLIIRNIQILSTTLLYWSQVYRIISYSSMIKLFLLLNLLLVRVQSVIISLMSILLKWWCLNCIYSIFTLNITITMIMIIILRLLVIFITPIASKRTFSW